MVMQKSTSEEKNSSMTDIDDVNNLKGSVILKYINLSGGSSNIILLFILLLISQLSLNLSDYWITLWSEEEYIRHLYKPTSNSNSSYSNKASLDGNSFRRLKAIYLDETISDENYLHNDYLIGNISHAVQIVIILLSMY